jgi:NADH-quinone oxidoreductase subunit F
VELRTSTRVGRDISFEQLRSDYDAVVLATGAHKSWTLDVEGENLKGVWGAVEFLREVNLGKKASIGKQVAVIGGGNTAIDAARTAVRLGAKEVTILYRRERKDMPAWENEIEAALAEGVKIEYLVAPVRFSGEKGKLKKIVCQRMQLAEFDRSGRRKAVAVPAGDFELAVDTVIPAISQSSDASFIPEGAGIRTTKNGTFELAPRSRTRSSVEGVFVAGDAVLGPATVVEAIAGGHLAAREVDDFIRERNHEPAYREPPAEKIDIPFEVDEETVERPRARMPELHLPERIAGFKEVELGYGRDIAWLESCRCQRCDGCEHEK